jgi:hypothetical protein
MAIEEIHSAYLCLKTTDFPTNAIMPALPYQNLPYRLIRDRRAAYPVDIL